MRYIISVFCMALIMTVMACEGPVGPTGPRGPAGADGADGTNGGGAEITVYSGTLLAEDLIDSDYWEIEVGQDLENWLVIVLVRQEAGLAWFEPFWDILEFENGITTVAVYTDDYVVAGYEYRIAVAE